ncbi:MAG: cation:proton antiporter, partial [Candidatus Cloacimonadota bacterium]|nr:cation:proton antiporter [Candidatus Cloacimonadota bacterium]
MDNLSFYLLFLGISILAALIFSRSATFIKSPLIIGYIVAGAILGPSIIGFISFEQIKSLQIVNVVTLSLIGFGIGGELRWKAIRKLGKSIIFILFFESFGAFLFVGIILSIFLKNIPIGIIFGALAVATAPAATVEVVRQYKAKGRLTTTLYAIVGLDDILALLIFVLAMPVALTFLGGANSGTATSVIHALSHAGLETLITILIGAGIGFILILFVKYIYERTILLLFSLGIILVNCGIAETLELSPILLNMAMGIVVVNYSAVNSRKIFSALGDWSPPMYVWFFVLVGARLDLPCLVKFIGLALIYILARSIGKWFGSFVGGQLGRAKTTVKKYLGFCLLDQAGVAIGLALAASKTLEKIGLVEYGAQIMSTITATTFIVMLIGPIFLKYALFKSGEAK